MEAVRARYHLYSEFLDIKCNGVLTRLIHLEAVIGLPVLGLLVYGPVILGVGVTVIAGDPVSVILAEELEAVLSLKHTGPGIHDSIVGLHHLSLGRIPIPIHSADRIDSLISRIVLGSSKLHDIGIGRPSGSSCCHHLCNEGCTLAEVNFEGIGKIPDSSRGECLGCAGNLEISA